MRRLLTEKETLRQTLCGIKPFDRDGSRVCGDGGSGGDCDDGDDCLCCYSEVNEIEEVVLCDDNRRNCIYGGDDRNAPNDVMAGICSPLFWAEYDGKVFCN